MFEEAPPLKVWAYSALAAFSLVLLFLFYCYSGFGPYAEAREKSNKSLEESLIENNTRDTSEVSVVILGSSLLERALVNPQELEERIIKQTKRKTNVLRVAIYFMNMDLAERIDFFEYITKYPPRYLFIENLGMNLNDAFGEALPTPIDAALLDLRNRFRKFAGLAPHENYYTKWYNYNTKLSPGNDFYTGNFDSLMFKSFQTKEMFVRKVSDNEIANKAYEALKGHTKIIFLGMPHSDKLRHHFLDENANAEFNKVLAFYKKKYNIDYWPYPGFLPDSCFIDGFHLNYRGAIKYQDWFVSQFASMK